MRFTILKIILSAVFLVVLGFIISRSIDVNVIKKELYDFPKLALILLLCISASMSLLKAWRFLILLQGVKVKISFWESLKSYVAGQAITPIPGGEAARGVFLKKEAGVGFNKSSGPIISQAFLELFSAAFLMLVGSFFFKILRVPAIAISLGLFLIFLFIVNDSVYGKIKKFLPSEKVHSAREGIKMYKKSLLSTLFLSLSCHVLGGVLFMIIAHYYNPNFDIFKSTFIYSSGVVIQGLSISPGGIGLTEGGLLGILLLFKVPLESALPMVLILRTTTLVFYILTGLIFIGLFYIRKESNEK